MKKLLVLIFLLVVVIIVLFTLPYWVGAVAQRQLPQFNQRLATSIPFKFLNSRYERGWFQSSAQSTLTTDIPPLKGHLFTLQHQFQHGFLPVQMPRIQSTLQTPWCPLTLQTSFQISGAGTSVLNAPVCSIKEETNSIQWQAWHGETQFTRDFSQFQGNIKTPLIQVDTEQTHLLIQEMGLHYRFEPPETNVDLATANVEFGKETKVLFDKAQVKAHTQLTEGYLAVTAETQVNQMLVGEKRYTAIYLNLALTSLHLETLREIQTTLYDLYKRDLPAWQQKWVLTGMFIQHVPTLLRHSPELTVSQFRFTLPEGTVEGQLHAKINKLTSEALFKPALLMQMLTLQAAVSLPQATLAHLARLNLDSQGISPSQEAIDQQVKFWLDQGFCVPLAQKPDYCQIQIHSDGDSIQLNQKHVSWDDLLGY